MFSFKSFKGPRKFEGFFVSTAKSAKCFRRALNKEPAIFRRLVSAFDGYALGNRSMFFVQSSAKAFGFVVVCLFFFSTSVFAQYSPRGTSLNDGYWPNLDEPDKWILGVESLFDLQRETDTSNTTSFQLSHGHFNWQYGGQELRGGLQVIYDDTRSRGTSDLSIGAGVTFNRPLFFEFGAGYLTRTAGTQNFDGWTFNAKVGYYFRLSMHVKYRFRFRFSLNGNYKTIREGTGDREILSFYPLLGFEFET